MCSRFHSVCDFALAFIPFVILSVLKVPFALTNSLICIRENYSDLDALHTLNFYFLIYTFFSNFDEHFR